MKKARIFPLAAILLSGMAVMSCGNKYKEEQKGLPQGFAKFSDTEKVGYVMKHVEPDSVARFIIDATLGRLGDVKIDSINVAATYAYANFNDSSLLAYSVAFDDYSQALPLPDKMRIYVAVGKSVPQQLGYQLGLEYVSQIRSNHKSVGDVRQEMEEFRKVCADDTVTYTRFVKGFQTALEVDHGQDLPEEIYNAFGMR